MFKVNSGYRRALWQRVSALFLYRNLCCLSHQLYRDLLTATIYNNTALLYKSQQLIEEAKKYYNQAYDIRR